MILHRFTEELSQVEMLYLYLEVSSLNEFGQTFLKISSNLPGHLQCITPNGAPTACFASNPVYYLLII
jgi:hypothetical protein